tara:strand:+ start:1970 stop:2458 length:489 start_codon:yes stop_codon:yes gene_type:complete
MSESLIALLSYLGLVGGTLVFIKLHEYLKFKQPPSSKGKSSVHNGPVKEVYVKWDENTNFIMAFISEHFKTSNTLLIEELSNHLGRSASSLKRKISRLRGIKSGKSPYASDLEREFVETLYDSELNDKGYCRLFMTALINIGLSDSEIMNLKDLMVESELIK